MTERKIVIEGDGAKYSVDKAEGRSHIEQGSEKRATPDRQDGDRVSGEKKEKGKGKAQSSDSSGESINHFETEDTRVTSGPHRRSQREQEEEEQDSTNQNRQHDSAREVSWLVVNGKREVAVKSHYQTLEDLNEGDVLRLWADDNVAMHLSTVIIIRVIGKKGTCLKIECPKPHEVDGRFKKYHAKIEKEKRDGRHVIQPGMRNADVQGNSNFVTGVLDLDSGQDLREDCWTDLKDPWNITIGAGYKFVWCGVLTNDSFRILRQTHYELYRGAN